MSQNPQDPARASTVAAKKLLAAMGLPGIAQHVKEPTQDQMNACTDATARVKAALGPLNPNATFEEWQAYNNASAAEAQRVMGEGAEDQGGVDGAR